jgi:hypothetical protein
MAISCQIEFGLSYAGVTARLCLEVEENANRYRELK